MVDAFETIPAGSTDESFLYGPYSVFPNLLFPAAFRISRVVLRDGPSTVATVSFVREAAHASRSFFIEIKLPGNYRSGSATALADEMCFFSIRRYCEALSCTALVHWPPHL